MTLLVLDPFREFPPLFPNIHEPRPALQQTKRVAHVILLDLAAAVPEASLALAFDLSRPHTPLDGPQPRGPHDETKADDEGRDDRLDRDVEGERRRCAGLRGGERRERRGPVSLERGVFAGRVTATRKGPERGEGVALVSKIRDRTREEVSPGEDTGRGLLTHALIR